VDFAEALLKLWSRKVQMLAAPPAGDSRRLDALVIDPAKPIGARARNRGPISPRASASSRRIAIEQHPQAHPRFAGR
jgi:hypothetical protein